MPLREEAKLRYRDKKNIEKKWLEQYGAVSRDNDYQRNRACLSELFNMLDVVMDIVIEDFRHDHVIVAIDAGRRGPVYTFAMDDDGEVTFSMPTTFAARTRVLRMIGYPISDDVVYDTRLLRNETTHGNQTIVLQHLTVGYEETMKAMLSIADALICLKMLAPALRTPSFDQLRVREGDTLLGDAYLIGKPVGEGGMSRVYEAVHKRTGRRLAVKEMKPETFSEDIIRHECDVLARLNHEGIPRINDSFSENSTFYIVMEFVDGLPLDRWLKEREATKEQKENIVRSLCGILEYLHGNDVGIVFVDLSPDNIMIGENGELYLIDFGISGKIDEQLPVQAATPGYSAPEVFAGRMVDQRADIYSLGKILQLLYTGEVPDQMPEAVKGADEEAEAAPEMPADNRRIAEVIARCTARNPQERYESVEEVERALFPLAADAQAPASKRKLWGGLAAAAVIAGAAIFTGYHFYQAQQNAAGGQKDAYYGQEAHEELTFPEDLSDHAMDWKDDMLEAEMRGITGIGEGDIMLSDVWGMTELSLSNCGIEDISALEELTNLRTLDLNFNRISDISPLAAMTGLKDLYLEENNVRDLTPLAGLLELEDLDLGKNEITDLTPLKELKSLKRAAVNDNPLDTDAGDAAAILSDTFGSMSLYSLDISGLQVTDVSWIGAYPELTELYMNNNEVTDLSFLEQMDQLEKLYVKNNGLTDLSSLSGLSELTELDIQDNPIDDLSPLSEMKKMTWLDMKGCRVSDLTPVSGMVSLTSMDASENQIADLTPLSGLSRLSYLDLAGNNISDLEGLRTVTSLNYLNLSSNSIRDITPLAGLKSLQRVYLTGNEIGDYSPLDQLDLLECETDER